MCTFSQCAVLPRLLSSLQCFTSTQRRIRNFIRDSTWSKSGFGSKPSVATSTHVPSRAMCPRCPSTNCDLLLHASYREYRLRHKICPRSNTRHLPQRSRLKLRPTTPSLSLHRNHHAVSLSSPQMEPHRLNPVQMRVYELPQFLFYINTIGSHMQQDADFSEAPPHLGAPFPLREAVHR